MTLKTSVNSNSQPKSIVIIGGGIIGSSIAYYLSRAISASSSSSSSCYPQCRIILVETSSQPAAAASGKAGGFLALDWHGSATASLAKLSFQLHQQLAQQQGGQDKWGYRQVETWQVETDTRLKHCTNQKPKHVIPWLDQDTVKSISNMGGNGTTAQVTSAKLTQYLVDQSKQAGVETLFSSRAVGLEFKDCGRIKAVKIQDMQSGTETTLEATDIVLAAGPWTGSLITTLFPRRLLPPHLRAAASIGGSRAHSIIVESAVNHHPLTADCLFTEMTYGSDGYQAGASEVYCRSDGTAYLCGGSDNLPLPDTADEVSYDPKQITKLIEQASVLAPNSLDPKAGAKVVAKQACYLPISNSTGNPILGGKDGVYVAAGHSCWGITNSLGTGKVMQELILQGKVSSADIEALMPC